MKVVEEAARRSHAIGLEVDEKVRAELGLALVRAEKQK